ncbi:MAG TPA: hypothetical protein VGK73_35155 [Polyangiaceae bacterium]
MNARRSALFVTILLVGCRSEEKPPPPAAPQADSAQAAVPPPSAAPAPPVEPAPSAFVRPPGKVAELVDLGLYEFRVQSLGRCGKPSPGKQPVVAASVQVNAKGSDFFVAPRDVSLEKDGVIFASLPHEKLPQGCGSALAPVQLRPAGSASGVVGFELPADVDAKGAKLVYKPTRWGGAPPAVVTLPDAL